MFKIKKNVDFCKNICAKLNFCNCVKICCKNIKPFDIIILRTKLIVDDLFIGI
jgi:hypothetical protein